MVAEAKKSTENLESIKRKLLVRKNELEEQLVELYKAKEAPSQVQDPGDHAQTLSQETLNISLQDTEIMEYNMIRQALKMIEQGTYGLCIECEQPILEKRLKLYPNATRCLVCQELLEEQQPDRF